MRGSTPLLRRRTSRISVLAAPGAALPHCRSVPAHRSPGNWQARSPRYRWPGCCIQTLVSACGPFVCPESRFRRIGPACAGMALFARHGRQRRRTRSPASDSGSDLHLCRGCAITAQSGSTVNGDTGVGDLPWKRWRHIVQGTVFIVAGGLLLARVQQDGIGPSSASGSLAVAGACLCQTLSR